MARPSSITATSIPHILRAARAAGVDATSVAARLGLPPSPSFEDRVPLTRLFALWEAITSLGDDGIPARAAASIDARDERSLLNLCCQSMSTMRDALSLLHRYWPTVTDGYRWAVEMRGTAFSLVCDETKWIDRAGWRCHIEYDAVDMACVGVRITGGALRPARVSFAHRRPRFVDAHAAALGVVPQFSASRTELVYPRGSGDLPLVGARPALAQALEPMLSTMLERSLAARPASVSVRELIPTLVRAGRATAGEAARRLQVSSRTLERRLAEEGTSFRALLGDTRRRLAAEWLRAVPIAEVAERLGYADTRAFDRAFRRWTGMTPSSWRRRAR